MSEGEEKIMDLGAYAQIDDLEQVLKDNGIVIPRLRGLRLMSEEEIIPKEAFTEQILFVGLNNCEDVLCEKWYGGLCFREYSDITDYKVKKYLIKDGSGIKGIMWNKVHGKLRNRFKYELKIAKRAVEKELNTFNKYVGRKDVLYIHARIGGNNWADNGGPEIAKQPWFIERVDDSFDSTYCDIYAKIKEQEHGN